jgi:hypothetical protein
VLVSPAWKYDLYREVREALRETRDVREIVKLITVDKQHAAEIVKLVPVLVRDPSRLSGTSSQEEELRSIEGASDYLHKVFGCTITVQRAEDSTEAKAKNGSPGKPAILLR